MLNYHYLRKKKEREVEKVLELPKEGTWVTISHAAQIKGYSSQGIRLMYLNNKIKGIKPLGGGALLVCLEDIPEKKQKL